MKYLIYSLLTLTLSFPSLAINWDAVNQSKVQQYHQLVADLEREDRLKAAKQAESQHEEPEYIHSAERMEACLERLDTSYNDDSDILDINRRIHKCSDEARITIEQWQQDMAEKYRNEQ